MGTFLVSIFGIILIAAIIGSVVDTIKKSRMTPNERKSYEDRLKDREITSKWGSVNPIFVLIAR